MKNNSFAPKAIACILSSIVIGASFARNTKWNFPDIPPVIAFGIALVMVIASIVYSLVWYQKDKKGIIDSSKRLALFQGLLRYGIAFELCMIAWQKIFHHQFVTPIGKLDNPFSSFAPIELMWAFFGQSYPFIVVIGVSQIIGSVLLLFGRTRLVGVFVLLPVMLNIVLIDIFYQIEPGPLAQAIILFTGVLYFLFIEYDKLKSFFFFSRNDLSSFPFSNQSLKNMIRLSVVVIPFLIIVTNKRLAAHTFHQTPLPEGRYEVRQLSVNHQPIDLTDCRDSTLTMIYLQHDIVLQSGSPQRRLFGQYTYNKDTREMKAVWHFPKDRKDTLVALVNIDHDKLTIDGTMGRNAVKMELERVVAPRFP